MVLCAFCQHHTCGKEFHSVCNCVVKHKQIEHWFVACREQFKDRRERSVVWAGAERRTTAQRMVQELVRV